MKENRIFCKGGGCTAKLGPAALQKVLKQLPKFEDPNLLVGFEGSDDAAVYRLTDELAIVQTLDFFPPMVEDPYLFGQIAAANALSDVYAMGGTVKTALNIVCFPENEDLNLLGEILQGGSDKVREAGGVLSGGHSIADEGIKYGLSVTGMIHPGKILRNNTCRPGDQLLLTKPLGVGIVTTADRVGEASEEAKKLAVRSMSFLNRRASEILREYPVHGCTDVTGFSFLGHLMEMLDGGYTAAVDSGAVPYIPEARAYADEFYLTAGGQRNRNFLGDLVEFRREDFAMEEILFDPQTSGGLLAALSPKDASEACKRIEELGLPCGIVGEVFPGEKKILVN